MAECFENFGKFFRILFSETPDKNKLQSTKVAAEDYEGAANKELHHVVDAMSGSFLPATRKTPITLWRRAPTRSPTPAREESPPPLSRWHPLL
ncbi:MAG: hypothetical protein IJ043_02930 [Clostridia bacterium]|nr:hypothetical protein [Clostridia bacterium]